MSDGAIHERERQRDADARRLAQTVFDRPLLLEAGAGTGKTATLVARIVAWCVGPGWERTRGALLGRSSAELAARTLEGVVAITFTEAAASELAQRVARALRELVETGTATGLDRSVVSDDPEVRARARALLGEIDRLVARTIHAYCRRLLASFPLEAGLHPNFRIDPDGSEQREVVRQVLEARLREAYTEADDGDLLALAALGFGPRELEEALERLVLAGVPATALAGDPLDPERVRAFLARGRERVAAVWGAAGPVLLGVASVPTAARTARALAASGELLGGSVPGPLEARLTALRELWTDDLDTLRRWSRGDLGVRLAQQLGEAATPLRAAAGPLARWLAHAAALDLPRLACARRALAPLLVEVRAVLRARGIAGYADLVRDAVALVEARPDIRVRVRGEIDQLLVDEFQDTDALQCVLVRHLALSGPRSQRPGLFLVGDPKQSIYGWRGADLEAYDRFAAELRAAGGSVERLRVCFRCAPPVLDEVERLIGPVMRERAGRQPAFHALVPAAERTRAPGFVEAGCAPVEHWISWAWDAQTGEPRLAGGGAAAELEAGALACELERLHREHGVPFGEIALLFRARSDLDVYLDALRERGVPYDVEGDRSYYRRREVIELAALVRCAIDPGDALSLLTWLRSAAVGVPDAALIPLWTAELPAALARLTAADPASLERAQSALEAALPHVPRDVPGLARIAGWEDALRDAVVALAELRASFERDPADRFVEKLRTRTLLEATEAGRQLGVYRIANLERFLRQLTESLASSAGDPQAVLRSLRQSVRDAEEEEEGRPKDAVEDAVQVRTIHQAKGLDFRHVYLVQAHKEPLARAAVPAAEPLDGHWEYALLGAATPGLDALVERQEAVARAEQVRLLYVALTRAAERLVVIGSWPRPVREIDPDAARQHAQLLPARAGGVPDLDALFADCAAGRAEAQLDALGARWVALALRPLPAAHVLELQDEPPDALVSAATAESEALARARRAAAERARRPRSAAPSSHGAPPAAVRAAHAAAPDVAMEVGRALHHLLETFDLSADLAAELARQRAQLAELLAAPLMGGARRAARARAGVLLEAFHAGPLAARLRALAPHIAARELPILAPPGGGPAHPTGYSAGVIDLVYRDPETGEWVVADYKTDAVLTPTEVFERAQYYAPQAQAYAQAVRSALELERMPRAELWFLQAGLIELAKPLG